MATDSCAQVIVIGAGIAGLTAAWQLKQAEIEVFFSDASLPQTKKLRNDLL